MWQNNISSDCRQPQCTRQQLLRAPCRRICEAGRTRSPAHLQGSSLERFRLTVLHQRPRAIFPRPDDGLRPVDTIDGRGYRRDTRRYGSAGGKAPPYVHLQGDGPLQRRRLQLQASIEQTIPNRVDAHQAMPTTQPLAR